MDLDGIDVRPLRQITGGAHFNEVFFRDARVPAANLIGALDDGWRVARTTLMNERLSAVSTTSCAEAFAAVAGLGRRDGVDASTDRQAVADVYTRGCLIDVTTGRVRSSLARDGVPGPESSILKLAAAAFSTEVAVVGNRVLGTVATLVGDDALDGGRWADALLGSFAMHIGGGTDEIQRNVIGESVLGLPREPRVDAEVPFRLMQKIGVQ
jgi:alkylation response protein AidB-like acyl-CoA dehydrogenase